MENLRSFRRQAGMSQTDLARACGLDQSYISKLESGWDGATIRTMREISEALGVPLHLLLHEEISVQEARLLLAFRSLSESRQKGWLDLLPLISGMDT